MHAGAGTGAQRAWGGLRGGHGDDTGSCRRNGAQYGWVDDNRHVLGWRDSIENDSPTGGGGRVNSDGDVVQACTVVETPSQSRYTGRDVRCRLHVGTTPKAILYIG